MAAQNTLTFDLPTPRRPSLDDVDGAAFANHPSRPPNPGVQPTAESYNQLSKLVVALGAMVPLAVISLRFSGTTPLIDSAITPKTMTPTFTPVRANAGNTTITWPAGTFPNPTVQPTASLNATGNGSEGYTISCVPITNGVQVSTGALVGLGSVATDLPYTVVVR